MVDGAVIPDLAGLAEHDAHAVVDKQTLADGGTRVDLDAGAVAAMLADPPCQKKVLVLVQPGKLHELFFREVVVRRQAAHQQKDDGCDQ